MRWPHDGAWPCPDTGPALLARIARLIDPWQSLRVRLLWLYGGRW